MSENPKFKHAEIELSILAKAISNPARVLILKELASRKSCVCGEIVKVLPLAQAPMNFLLGLILVSLKLFYTTLSQTH